MRIAFLAAPLLLVAVSGAPPAPFFEDRTAQSGIGFLAMDAREFLRTDVIVLTIVIYALIGVAADAIARFLERRLLAWHPNYGAAR